MHILNLYLFGIFLFRYLLDETEDAPVVGQKRKQPSDVTSPESRSEKKSKLESPRKQEEEGKSYIVRFLFTFIILLLFLRTHNLN